MGGQTPALLKRDIVNHIYCVYIQYMWYRAFLNTAEIINQSTNSSSCWAMSKLIPAPKLANVFTLKQFQISGFALEKLMRGWWEFFAYPQSWHAESTSLWARLQQVHPCTSASSPSAGQESQCRERPWLSLICMDGENAENVENNLLPWAHGVAILAPSVDGHMEYVGDWYAPWVRC